MAEAKKCPVDRGKLLIGLECCVDSICDKCPYFTDCAQQITDSLAYIYYLEERLEEAGKNDT